MNNLLYNLVLKVLNSLDRYDYNLGSESARQTLAKKIVEGLNNETSN